MSRGSARGLGQGRLPHPGSLLWLGKSRGKQRMGGHPPQLCGMSLGFGELLECRPWGLWNWGGQHKRFVRNKNSSPPTYTSASICGSHSRPCRWEDRRAVCLGSCHAPRAMRMLYLPWCSPVWPSEGSIRPAELNQGNLQPPKPPRGQLSYFGHTFGCHNWEGQGLLASDVDKHSMMLHRTAPKTGYPASHVTAPRPRNRRLD